MSTTTVTASELSKLVNHLEKGHWSAIAHSVCLDLLAGYAYFYRAHFLDSPIWTQTLAWESKGAETILTLMPKPQGKRSFEQCRTEVKAAARLLLFQAFGLPLDAESYDASALSDEESDAVRTFLDSADAYATMRAIVSYAVELQKWQDANAALMIIHRATGETHPDIPAPTMPTSLMSMIQKVKNNES